MTLTIKVKIELLFKAGIKANASLTAKRHPNIITELSTKNAIIDSMNPPYKILTLECYGTKKRFPLFGGLD